MDLTLSSNEKNLRSKPLQSFESDQPLKFDVDIFQEETTVIDL